MNARGLIQVVNISGGICKHISNCPFRWLLFPVVEASKLNQLRLSPKQGTQTGMVIAREMFLLLISEQALITEADQVRKKIQCISS
jgi:hypothetical protein